VIFGRSAGAIFSFAATNIRPELPGLTIAEVPFLDWYVRCRSSWQLSLWFVSLVHLLFRSGRGRNIHQERFAFPCPHSLFNYSIGTMLDESVPLTLTDREEFGDPHDARHLAVLAAYSPYHNIRQEGPQPHEQERLQPHYSNVLLLGGLRDPRVQYWEPLKAIARFVHDACPRLLVLLRVFILS
jgi:protease II